MGKKNKNPKRAPGAGSAPSANRLFSIGHSNLEFPRFVQLLQAVKVSCIVDVRSQPFSRWLPWTNRPILEEELERHHLRYLFMGDTLGGRPRQIEVYDSEGRLDYERVKTMDVFQDGIQNLLKALEESKLAMLCSEEDPIDCHRGLLIAPVMKERGIAATHIRGDGSRETQEQFEARLIDVTGAGGGFMDGLFAASMSEEDRRQMLADAYQIQTRRKAFRLSPQPLAEPGMEWREERGQE